MDNHEQHCPLCGEPVPQTPNHPIAEHFAREHPGYGSGQDDLDRAPADLGFQAGLEIKKSSGNANS